MENSVYLDFMVTLQTAESVAMTRMHSKRRKKLPFTQAKTTVSFLQTVLLLLGTTHYLCLRLGPKGSRLGEWFFVQPYGWVYNFYASRRFDGTLLIALYWLGSYYFIVHKVG